MVVRLGGRGRVRARVRVRVRVSRGGPSGFFYNSYIGLWAT